MHIQIDSRNPNSIVSYNEAQLMINDVIYNSSLIVSAHGILSPWPIQSLSELTEANLTPILQHGPELIIIGHAHLGAQPPMAIQEWLSRQRIGLECMQIGAACRTFNLLISEGRSCVAGFIFNPKPSS